MIEVRSCTSNFEMTGAASAVKMSVFAERSGVPAPTIKHYVREGLLPEPVRTSRNMAKYDLALVPRVRTIKELQRKFFLPLSVIRDVLKRIDDGTDPADVAVEAGIQKVLRRLAPAESRTRAELLESGMPPQILDMFTALGAVTPEVRDGVDVFSGDDLTLLRLLGRARRAGLSPEMLPARTVQVYINAIQALVEAELSMFRAGLHHTATDNVGALSQAAAEMSEQLVVLLRRKLLLPTLRRLASAKKKRAPAKTKRRTATPRKRNRQ